MAEGQRPNGSHDEKVGVKTEVELLREQLQRKDYVIMRQKKFIDEATAAFEAIEQGPGAVGIYEGKAPPLEPAGQKSIQLYQVRDLGNSSLKFLPALSPDVVEALDNMSIGERVLLDAEGKVIRSIVGREPKGQIATVREVFPDGTLDLETMHDTHVFARRGGSLADEILKPGNRVVYHDSSGIALFRVSDGVQHAHREAPVLDKSFDDIGGLENVKKEFRQTFEMFYSRREDMAALEVPVSKGVLLYGPAGCGKTVIAKAMTRHLDEYTIAGLERIRNVLLARHAADTDDMATLRKIYEDGLRKPLPGDKDVVRNHLDRILRAYGYDPLDRDGSVDRVERMLSQDRKSSFLYMNGPDLLDKWVGNNERNVRDLFQDGREKAHECGLAVIFIDECEGVFRRRGISDSSAGYLDNIVATFNSQMNGMDDNENVFVMLASNFIENIDPAVIRDGRIDLKIKVDRPDKAAAKAILSKYFKDRFRYDDQFVRRYGSNDAAREALIESCLTMVFDEGEENKIMNVTYDNGKTELLYVRNLLSGAMLENIANRAKRLAVARGSDGEYPLIRLDDLQQAFSDIREGHRHIQSTNVVEEIGKNVGRRIKDVSFYNKTEQSTRSWTGR
jgi:ATP-dependent 26S proteasome regulatory subunit